MRELSEIKNFSSLDLLRVTSVDVDLSSNYNLLYLCSSGFLTNPSKTLEFFFISTYFSLRPSSRTNAYSCIVEGIDYVTVSENQDEWFYSKMSKTDGFCGAQSVLPFFRHLLTL